MPRDGFEHVDWEPDEPEKKLGIDLRGDKYWAMVNDPLWEEGMDYRAYKKRVRDALSMYDLNDHPTKFSIVDSLKSLNLIFEVEALDNRLRFKIAKKLKDGVHFSIFFALCSESENGKIFVRTGTLENEFIYKNFKNLNTSNEV